MNLAQNFTPRHESWRDSKQDRAEILAAVNLLLGEDLGKIRSRILARFWPLGILLPGKNLGEIHCRIPARFWLPGCLLPGKNHGEIRGRIPARFWPPGISLLGENLAGIPPGFPLRSRRDPGKIVVLFYKGWTLLHFEIVVKTSLTTLMSLTPTHTPLLPQTYLPLPQTY